MQTASARTPEVRAGQTSDNSVPQNSQNVNKPSENNLKETIEDSSAGVSEAEKTAKKEGAVTVKADESKLTERQKVSIEGLRGLAKATGINFVVEKRYRTRIAKGSAKKVSCQCHKFCI